MSETSHVKVLFRLEIVDDWPDVEVEGMWATALGGNRYKIDNIPFHAMGVSDQDVVIAGDGNEPGVWFEAVAEPSEFSTIRIAVADPADKQAARDYFRNLGAESEGLNSPMFALSIPRNVLPKVVSEVKAGEASGRWDWEEGVIRP